MTSPVLFKYWERVLSETSIKIRNSDDPSSHENVELMKRILLKMRFYFSDTLRESVGLDTVEGQEIVNPMELICTSDFVSYKRYFLEIAYRLELEELKEFIGWIDHIQTCLESTTSYYRFWSALDTRQIV